MADKIFINYRRDDTRADAARIRDRLAQALGEENVFMDVDNLLVGQRFDMELEKSLDHCDVFLAVMGPFWLDQLQQREKKGERDFVREEIAAALKRGRLVIPVMIERTPLPRKDQLPADIADLVMHHKYELAHESFGRDIAGLIEGIKAARRVRNKPTNLPWRGIAAGVAGVLVVGAAAIAARSYLNPGPSDQGTPDVTVGSAEVAGTTQRPTPAEKGGEAASLSPPSAGVLPPGSKAKPLTAQAERDLKRGVVFKDCDNCPEMVVVPAGAFMMGSPDSETGRLSNEGPQRKVTFAKPFAVGRYEVTFNEWNACAAGGGCGANKEPGDQGYGRGRRPVVAISWNDAADYAVWLSKVTGKPYRLLTEAEWEYAARAGGTAKYAWGDEPGANNANCDGCKSQWDNTETAPVGSFKPNAFGIFDMHGNVWEWVQDCFAESYVGAPADGTSKAVDKCADRVLRGGSLFYDPGHARAAFRWKSRPTGPSGEFGFRIARSLAQ